MAVITVTTQPAVEPGVHAPTFYEQLVTEISAAVDQLAAIIPKVVESEKATAEDVRSNLGVPYVFCITAIKAFQQLPQLAATKQFDPERARLQLDFIEAFSPLCDKLSGICRRLKHAIRASKSEVGTDALHIYRIAQGVASDERNPIVQEQVDAMKRDLGRKTNPKAEREERKAQKIREEVEKAMIRHGVDRTIIDRFREETEMKKAA